MVDVLCYLLVCDISLCQPPQLFRGREVLVTNCRGSCSLIPKLATYETKLNMRGGAEYELSHRLREFLTKTLASGTTIEFDDRMEK